MPDIINIIQEPVSSTSPTVKIVQPFVVKAFGYLTKEYADTLYEPILTGAKLDAITSGITVEKVTSYDAHLIDTDNPHSVTKSQIGLSNVENYGQSAVPVQGSNLYFTAGGAYTLKTYVQTYTQGLLNNYNFENGSGQYSIVQKSSSDALNVASGSGSFAGGGAMIASGEGAFVHGGRSEESVSISGDSLLPFFKNLQNVYNYPGGDENMSISYMRSKLPVGIQNASTDAQFRALTLYTGEAKGDGSVSFGGSTFGSPSFIAAYSGWNTGFASAVFGNFPINTGNNSIVGGVLNYNDRGSASFLIGSSNKNTRNNAIIGGQSNTNNGEGCIITGDRNTNTGSNSLTVGYRNNNTSQNNIVSGSQNRVSSSTNSLVSGDNNIANADGVIVSGHSNINSAINSIVDGDSNTNASAGTNSILVGEKLSNIAEASAVFGKNNQNKASSHYSIIVGQNNINDGKTHCAIFGQEIINSGARSIIGGSKNNNSGNCALVAGGGTGDDDGNTNSGSSSIIVGNRNSNTALGSAVFGMNNNNSSRFALVMGRYLSATNETSDYGKLFLGKYNSYNANNIVEIGGGTADNARSNLFEITKTGIARAYGVPVDNYDLTPKSYVDTAVSNALARVYKPQGTETAANLNNLTKTASMNGYVWDCSGAGTLTNYDNTTVSVKAGDNVCLLWNNGNWKWDNFGGLVDLSNYYTKLQADNLLSDKADKVINSTNGDFAALDVNGNITDSGYKASDFVLTSRTIAGLDLSQNRTAQELTDSLIYCNNTTDIDYIMEDN